MNFAQLLSTSLEQLSNGFKNAYESDTGYHLQKNDNGKIDLYVRGTKKPLEWIQNVLESPITKVLFSKSIQLARRVSLAERKKYARKLDKFAEQNKVDRILGHSRGDAVISDMLYKAEKIGVDGAAILRRPKSKHVNYRQNQWFDMLISLGGPNNITIPDSPGLRDKNFHKLFK